jgi:putative ABC transport system permease protein
MLRNLIADIRLAARSLAQRPTFAAAAILTLGVGIGANTSVFGLVYGVLLRPLPYHDPGRLVSVFETNDPRGVTAAGTSLHDLEDWREATRAFADLAGWNIRSANLMADQPARVIVAQVTDGYFETFGTAAVGGRWFTQAESRPGGPPVVIASHAFWQRELGGSAAALGRTLNLDERPVTVVGVMPRGFSVPGAEVDLWQPLARTPDETGDRGGRWLTVVARLAPGVSLERAQRDLRAVADRLATTYPTTNRDWSVRLQPLRDAISGEARPALLLASIAVGALLLIACANVAGLLLARTADRRRELAVRVALGADRRRIVQHLFAESLVLSVGGGVLGVVAAWAALRLVPSLPALAGAITIPAGLDVRVLGYSMGLTVLSVLLFGIVPAVRGSRAAPRAMLAGPTPQDSRARNALVVVQIALAVALVVAAGLLTRSFGQALALDLGFVPRGLMTFRIAPPFRLPDDLSSEAAFLRALAIDRERIATTFDAIRDGLAAVPGVVGVSGINRLPLEGNWWTERLAADPLPDTDDPGVTGYYRAVLPDYFTVIGTPVIRGRGFTTADTDTAMPVAIVSAALARALWADGDPIGQRITTDVRAAASGSGRPVRWRTVVGIAADARMTRLEAAPASTIYVPMRQAMSGFGSDWSFSFVLRTDRADATIPAAAQRVVQAVAPTVPIFAAGSMEARVEAAVGPRRAAATIFVVFAGSALLLALIGLYGLLAGSVARRTREIGVRVAIGASPGAVWRLIVGHGLSLVAGGLAVGCTAALALSRLTTTLLFGVTPTDPWTYVGAVAGVVATAFVACLIPARRAMRLDPVATLRAE